MNDAITLKDADVGDEPTIMAPPPRDRLILEARKLDFFYGKTQALFEVELPVERNRITALIGPSGCGKSTLLRALNRIYELYPGQRAEGQIILDGEDVLNSPRTLGRLREKVSMVVEPGQAEDHRDRAYEENVMRSGTDLARLRSRVGMVFQKPTPFPMSIYDNIAFGIRLHQRKTKKQIDEIVETALRRAALWDEVKDKLQESRARALGRPAAAVVRRARHCSRTRGAAARRARFRARSHLDGQARADIARPEAGLHDRDRDP